jgi:hypothetical protein
LQFGIIIDRQKEKERKILCFITTNNHFLCFRLVTINEILL